MKCPECGTENNTSAQWCKFCGEQLTQKKHKTVVEGSPAQGSGQATGNAGTKRRTLYEPPSGGQAAAKQPTMKLPPPQPPPAVGGRGRAESPRPGEDWHRPADDFFDRPQPERQPLNQDDPWSHIADQGGYTENVPPDQRRAGKNRTVIERGGPDPRPVHAAQRTIVGALFIQVGGGPMGLVPLYEGRSTVGRDDDRDVVIEDERTSGQHGFINIEGENAVFMDASSNGSKVDGAVVKFAPATLQHGSVIQTGAARIIVTLLPPGLL